MPDQPIGTFDSSPSAREARLRKALDLMRCACDAMNECVSDFDDQARLLGAMIDFNNELQMRQRGAKKPPPDPPLDVVGAWLTVKDAAAHARVSVKVIYREVEQERLRAARVGGRRQLRFRVAWVDDWLERTAAPVEK